MSPDAFDGFIPFILLLVALALVGLGFAAWHGVTLIVGWLS